MSDLTFIEKSKLESLFRMEDGYVLDFSNRTMDEFVTESTGCKIFDEKYNYASGSKANRLRSFWAQEPNRLVGKLVHDLLEYCSLSKCDPNQHQLFQECESIAHRLRKSAAVEALEVITAEGIEQDFEVLVDAVKGSIEKNEPEVGLDRLHTYVTKLIRILAEKRGVIIDRGKPLHSIVGEYIKTLRSAGLVESEMTTRILKSTLSTMEAFNWVRNDKSLAHDNTLLNYDESLLIFNYVCSSIRFIRALEARLECANTHLSSEEMLHDEIPF